jgi:ComF family protein
MARVAIHESGCARCRREGFWNAAGVARVGAYTPGVRRLVTGLKYRRRQRSADFAAGLLAAVLAACGWGTGLDGLVPVPMHWLRRWQRPCDHTELLATALARRLHVPVLRAVRRVKHTPSQTGLTSRAQRFANVKGCFRAVRVALVRGKRVCIVDNLMATGATVHEVAKVLRRAGARGVYAAVIARTVLAGDAQAPDGFVAAGGEAGRLIVTR